MIEERRIMITASRSQLQGIREELLMKDKEKKKYSNNSNEKIIKSYLSKER
jgi:hypothetical protein